MKKILYSLVFIFASLVSANLASADLTTGMVAYYPFTGNSDDLSGNGNNGIVSGATLTTVNNKNPNSAYSFNGVDNYIEISDSPSLHMANAISIGAWVYVNDFDTNMQVIQKDSIFGLHSFAMPILSNDGYYYDWPSLGGPQPRKFGLELTLNGTFKSGMWSATELQAGKWNFIAATYDGSQVRLYLNGKLDKTYYASGAIETNNNPLRIGNFRNYSADFFDGTIDEIRIYSHALSESEIFDLFSKPTYNSITRNLHIPIVFMDENNRSEVYLEVLTGSLKKTGSFRKGAIFKVLTTISK